MINLYRFLVFAVTLVLLVACSSSQYDDALLFGDWQMVEWKNVTDERSRSGKVSFNFSEDGRYQAKLNGNPENGKFWISEDYLHTIEDGKAEKKVRILKLENDTLIFEMNRMGTMEEMVLVKG